MRNVIDLQMEFWRTDIANLESIVLEHHPSVYFYPQKKITKAHKGRLQPHLFELRNCN